MDEFTRNFPQRMGRLGLGLATTEDMLGLARLGNATSADSMRGDFGL